MARWKLLANHYMNVPDNEWEYTETDQRTGRPIRKRFPVPKLLDISDPSCWTNRWGNKDNEQGEIIVCHEGKGEPNDQIFFGDPTPDMTPLDDEARAITATFEEHWKYKPEEASASYSQSLISEMEKKFDAAMSNAASSKPDGLAELTNTMNQFMQQTGSILAALANRSVEAPSTTERRV